MFCDICDCFDLHDTEDCPTQTQMSESPPHTTYHGNKGEERPYCNICEVFGHWTESCNDDQTFWSLFHPCSHNQYICTSWLQYVGFWFVYVHFVCFLLPSVFIVHIGPYTAEWFLRISFQEGIDNNTLQLTVVVKDLSRKKLISWDCVNKEILYVDNCWRNIGLIDHLIYPYQFACWVITKMILINKRSYFRL